MIAEQIKVSLPSPLIRKIQKVAELTYRSFDEVVASTLDAALIAPPGLPQDLASELAAMHLLSDEALRIALQPLPITTQQRLQQLNNVGGERALTASGSSEQATLIELYQRSILCRAQAIAILKQRGHPIDETSHLQ